MIRSAHRGAAAVRGDAEAARMVSVPHTLLIVDDHAGFRSSARALLEADGWLVVVGEAGTGNQAIAAAHRLRPDAVLLDIALPDIDGFAVCESIMQRRDCPGHRGAHLQPESGLIRLEAQRQRRLAASSPRTSCPRPACGH